MKFIDKINDYLEKEDLEDLTYDLIDEMLDFISLIDLDNLNEEQINKIDKIIDLTQLDEELSERTKKMVRGGKVIRRKVCPKGKKLLDGKCVRITSSEKIARTKGAKRGARKKKGQQAQITRKRKKSIKKRHF